MSSVYSVLRCVARMFPKSSDRKHRTHLSKLEYSISIHDLMDPPVPPIFHLVIVLTPLTSCIRSCTRSGSDRLSVPSHFSIWKVRAGRSYTPKFVHPLRKVIVDLFKFADESSHPSHSIVYRITSYCVSEIVPRLSLWSVFSIHLYQGWYITQTYAPNFVDICAINATTPSHDIYSAVTGERGGSDIPRMCDVFAG
jgi:hypothetical protein